MENPRLMTHDELLQELDAIVYLKTDPPGAYDCAHVHGTIYEPLAQPAFPHDRPYWVPGRVRRSFRRSSPQSRSVTGSAPVAPISHETAANPAVSFVWRRFCRRGLAPSASTREASPGLAVCLAQCSRGSAGCSRAVAAEHVSEGASSAAPVAVVTPSTRCGGRPWMKSTGGSRCGAGRVAHEANSW
jgi:hypothetical protein